MLTVYGKVHKIITDNKSLLIFHLFNFRVFSFCLRRIYDNNNIDVKILKYAFLVFYPSVYWSKFSNKLFKYNKLIYNRYILSIWNKLFHNAILNETASYIPVWFLWGNLYIFHLSFIFLNIFYIENCPIKTFPLKKKSTVVFMYSLLDAAIKYLALFYNYKISGRKFLL